ncbi:MAG: hypothetical protein JJU23_10120 [Cyclobacteriaceae bacterium]|nr:hypothetical protein [Cyclobacteriaceae bacterium]
MMNEDWKKLSSIKRLGTVAKRTPEQPDPEQLSFCAMVMKNKEVQMILLRVIEGRLGGSPKF